MFAYGILGVMLVLYLAAAGLGEMRIGLLLTLTFLGDAALMTLGGGVMALTGDFTLLVLGATIGVISPTGGEVGPFLAVEQACLAQMIDNRDRTRIFAWYNVAGYAATAVGALAAGLLAENLQQSGWTALASYRALLAGYGALGVVIGLLSWRLDANVEAFGQLGAKRRPGARLEPSFRHPPRHIRHPRGGRLRTGDRHRFDRLPQTPPGPTCGIPPAGTARLRCKEK